VNVTKIREDTVYTLSITLSKEDIDMIKKEHGLDDGLPIKIDALVSSIIDTVFPKHAVRGNTYAKT
jgi:hypothetical protein